MLNFLARVHDERPLLYNGLTRWYRREEQYTRPLIAGFDPPVIAIAEQRGLPPINNRGLARLSRPYLPIINIEKGVAIRRHRIFEYLTGYQIQIEKFNLGRIAGDRADRLLTL